MPDGAYVFLLLIFAVIPTLALYGLGWSALAFLLRPIFGARRAAICAVLVLFAIAIGVPLAMNRAAAARGPASAPDRIPATRIALSGNVLIGDPSMLATVLDRQSLPESDRRRRPNFDRTCGELCVLLLTTGTVRSVTTIDDEGTASTYSISSDEGCAIDPRRDLENRGVIWWKKRKACLAELPLMRRPDLSIETVGDPWLLADVYPASRVAAPRVSSMVTTLRNSDRAILMQVTEQRLAGLVIPWSFCWSLDLNDNAGACAMETTSVPKSELWTHSEILADHTNIYDPRNVPRRPDLPADTWQR